MLKKIAVVLFVIALAGTLADAKSRKRRSTTSTSEPGKFDYYLLSLSWAPDFCARPNVQKNARECGTGNKVGFIVHGLWPQNEDGTYPKACAPASPVASGIVDRMLPIMMDAGLIQHEWRDHGTCSGLSSSAYFDFIRKVFETVAVPAAYKSLSQQIQVDPQDIEGKFADANPSFGKAALRVSCPTNDLAEVRICFSKDLKVRSCPDSERDCSTNRILMRPVR